MDYSSWVKARHFRILHSWLRSKKTSTGVLTIRDYPLSRLERECSPFLKQRVCISRPRYSPDWKPPWRTWRKILESDPWRWDSSRSPHVSFTMGVSGILNRKQWFRDVVDAIHLRFSSSRTPTKEKKFDQPLSPIHRSATTHEIIACSRWTISCTPRTPP